MKGMFKVCGRRCCRPVPSPRSIPDAPAAPLGAQQQKIEDCNATPRPRRYRRTARLS